MTSSKKRAILQAYVDFPEQRRLESQVHTYKLSKYSRFVFIELLHSAQTTICGKTCTFDTIQSRLRIGTEEYDARRMQIIQQDGDGAFMLRPYNLPIRVTISEDGNLAPSPGTVLFHTYEQDFRASRMTEASSSSNVLWAETVDVKGGNFILSCQKENDGYSYYSATIDNGRAVTQKIQLPSEMYTIGKCTTTLSDSVASLCAAPQFAVVEYLGSVLLIRHAETGVYVDTLMPYGGTSLVKRQERRYKNSRNPYTPNDDKDIMDSKDGQGELFYIPTVFVPLKGFSKSSMFRVQLRESPLEGKTELLVVYSSELYQSVRCSRFLMASHVSLYGGRAPYTSDVLDLLQMKDHHICSFSLTTFESTPLTDTTTRTCSHSNTNLLVAGVWQDQKNHSWLVSCSVVSTRLGDRRLLPTGPPEDNPRDVNDVFCEERLNRLRFTRGAVLLDISEYASAYNCEPKFIEFGATTGGKIGVCVKGDIGTAMYKFSLNTAFTKPRAVLENNYIVFEDAGVHSTLGGCTIQFENRNEELSPCTVDAVTINTTTGDENRILLRYPYRFTDAIDEKMMKYNESALMDQLNSCGVLEVRIDNDKYEPGIVPLTGLRDFIVACENTPLTFSSPETGSFEENEWSALHVDITPFQSHLNVYGSELYPLVPCLEAISLQYPETSSSDKPLFEEGNENFTLSAWVRPNPRIFWDSELEEGGTIPSPDLLTIKNGWSVPNTEKIDGIWPTMDEARRAVESMINTDNTIFGIECRRFPDQPHGLVYREYPGQKLIEIGEKTVRYDTCTEENLKIELKNMIGEQGGASYFRIPNPFISLTSITIPSILSFLVVKLIYNDYMHSQEDILRQLHAERPQDDYNAVFITKGTDITEKGIYLLNLPIDYSNFMDSPVGDILMVNIRKVCSSTTSSHISLGMNFEIPTNPSDCDQTIFDTIELAFKFATDNGYGAVTRRNNIHIVLHCTAEQAIEALVYDTQNSNWDLVCIMDRPNMQFLTEIRCSTKPSDDVRWYCSRQDDYNIIIADRLENKYTFFREHAFIHVIFSHRETIMDMDKVLKKCYENNYHGFAIQQDVVYYYTESQTELGSKLDALSSCNSYIFNRSAYEATMYEAFSFTKTISPENCFTYESSSEQLLIARLPFETVEYGPFILPDDIITIPNHTFTSISTSESVSSMATITAANGNCYAMTKCSSNGINCSPQCILNACADNGVLLGQGNSSLDFHFSTTKITDERRVKSFSNTKPTNMEQYTFVEVTCSGIQNAIEYMVANQYVMMCAVGGTWYAADKVVSLTTILEKVSGLMYSHSDHTLINYREYLPVYTEIKQAKCNYEMHGYKECTFDESLQYALDRGYSAFAFDSYHNHAHFYTYNPLQIQANIISSNSMSLYILSDVDHIVALQSKENIHTKMSLVHTTDRKNKKRVLTVHSNELSVSFDTNTPTHNKALDKMLRYVNGTEDSYSEWMHFAFSKRVPYAWTIKADSMNRPAMEYSGKMELTNKSVSFQAQFLHFAGVLDVPILVLTDCIKVYMQSGSITVYYWDHVQKMWVGGVYAMDTSSMENTETEYVLTFRTRVVSSVGSTSISSGLTASEAVLPTINPDEIGETLDCAPGNSSVSVDGEKSMVITTTTVSKRRGTGRRRRLKETSSLRTLVFDCSVYKVKDVITMGTSVQPLASLSEQMLASAPIDRMSCLDVCTSSSSQLLLGHYPESTKDAGIRLVRFALYDGTENMDVLRLGMHTGDLRVLLAPTDIDFTTQRSMNQMAADQSVFFSTSPEIAHVGRLLCPVDLPSNLQVCVNGDPIELSTTTSSVTYNDNNNVYLDKAAGLHIGPSRGVSAGNVECRRGLQTPESVRRECLLRKHNSTDDQLTASVQFLVPKKGVYRALMAYDDNNGRRVVVSASVNELDVHDSNYFAQYPRVLGASHGSIGMCQFLPDVSPIHWDDPCMVANAHFVLHDAEYPIFQSVVDGVCPVSRGYKVVQTSAGTGDLLMYDICVRDRRLWVGDGEKVDAVTYEFVCNLQSDAVLEGYIEGAPPVPQSNLLTENLDRGNDLTVYEGVSSVDVTITTTSEVERGSSSDHNTDGVVDITLTATGIESVSAMLAPLGFGTDVQRFLAGSFKDGLTMYVQGGGGKNTSNGWTRSSTTTQNCSSQLSGYWPHSDTKDDENYGEWQYRCNNIGHAFVRSKTLNLMLVRSVSTGAVIGYNKVDPGNCNEDINIISFDINPNYQQQGCLDGIKGITNEGKVIYAEEFKDTAPNGYDSSYKRIKKTYENMTRIDQALQQSMQEEEVSDPGRPKITATSYADVEAISTSARENSSTTKSPESAVPDFYVEQVWTSDGASRLLSASSNLVTRNATENHKNMCVSATICISGSFAVLGIGAKTEANVCLAHTRNWVQSGAESSYSTIDLSISTGLTDEATWTCLVDEETSNIDENTKQVLEREQLDCDVNTGFVYNKETNKRAWHLGAVTQYRTVTFFTGPSRSSHSMLFSDVIDPTWLEKASADITHPGNALAVAQHTASAPWRVHHDVTYVERVLPKEQPQGSTADQKKITLTTMTPVSKQNIVEYVGEREPSIVLDLSMDTVATDILKLCREHRLLWLLDGLTISGYEVDNSVSLMQLAETYFDKNSTFYLLNSDMPVEVKKFMSEDSYYSNFDDVRDMSALDGVFPKSRVTKTMLEFTSTMNAMARNKASGATNIRKKASGATNIRKNANKKLAVMVDQVWVNAAYTQRQLLLQA